MPLFWHQAFFSASWPLQAAAMDMLLRAHCDKGEFQQALDIAERARMAFKKIGDEVSGRAL